MKPPGANVRPPLPVPGRGWGLRQFCLMAVLLIGLLVLLFWKAIDPAYAVFSNDGPLGQLHAEWAQQPSATFGCWEDLNWVGSAMPTGLPSIAMALFNLVGYLRFAKVYAPFAILFLGLSAWFCFRQWKFSPAVCVLGGLAAALNSTFFSTACWGVAQQPIAFGLDFLALAALADESSPRRWVRVVLAGMAVGMGVTEATDIASLFSLLVAAFVIFQPFSGEGAPGRKLAGGLRRLAVVAGFAALLAASALSTLIGTQVKGIVGMGQDAASKAQRWNEATLWSLPKKETAGILVPGVFGFRMDTPLDMAMFKGSFQGGEYWGAVAQDPSYDRYFEAKKAGKEAPPPGGLRRYSGGGCYAGVLVILVAVWGTVQSFRKTNGVFSARERRFIRFWLAAALVSLLLAYGRFAPFYQLFYALPYASTIRNPIKFIHIFSWALVILFVYGLQGLSRLCLEGPAGAARDLPSHWKTWWAKAGAWERNWVKGSAVALAASLVAWLVYASKRDRLVAYLQEVGFDAARGDVLAGFSLRQVGWFIFFLALALGLVAVTLSGYFKGRRAKMGTALLGILLTVDLLAANLPWVIIYNWQQAYASNPVVDFLRARPYEQRVSVLPLEQFVQFERFPPEARPLLETYGRMRTLYDTEWKQHLFQYYNIQSLDIIMLPRVPLEYQAFETALRPTPVRRWELTNTRYLLSLAVPPDQLNRLLDPIQRRFKIARYFDVAPKPGLTGPLESYEQLTAVLTTNGPCALYEFTGALPHAKLYTNWQVSTNDEETLKQMASLAFDPAQKVLVAGPLPAPGATNQAAGTVDFTSYAPKEVHLRAKAGAPAVLLLNDKFDPGWKVTVDGKPAELLRCNYVMRGVRVPAGEHQVEFRFTASKAWLCVSLAGIALGLALLGFLALSQRREGEQNAQSAVHTPQSEVRGPKSGVQR